MLPFNQYITGRADGVVQTELDRLATRYEWFTTARRAKTLLTGQADPRLSLPLMFSPTIAPVRQAEIAEGEMESRAEAPEQTAPVPKEDIIERFLQHGGYRIVPDENSGEADFETTKGSGNDDDMLTEELAEIYRLQGLHGDAKEIYRKLSLLNPEKSIYFADIIAQIDKETNNN